MRIIHAHHRSLSNISAAICVLATSSLLVLTGCGIGPSASSSAAPIGSMQGAKINGAAFGGMQAITGATVQLYQVGVGSVAGAAGYSAMAVPLLTTTVLTSNGTGVGAGNTLPAGSFSITGDYSCSAGAELYLTISGGSPDNVVTDTNPNIALVAALGSCSALLAKASTAFVYVNEVSTVAAAYALAQFSRTSAFGTALSAQPGDGTTTAPADNIATSSGNTQGLINAMSTASVLANSFSLTSIPTGTAPGRNVTNTAQSEFWTINAIANAMSSCVNTTPDALNTAGDGSICGKLYSYTTPAGKTAPADTFQAALYLALYPDSANALSGTPAGSNLTGLITGQPPYLPYVNPANTGNTINDWTIAIRYSPQALPATTTTYLMKGPYSVAIDSLGNAWMMSNGITPGQITEVDAIGDPYYAGKTACAVPTACVKSDFDVTNYLIGSTSTQVGDAPGGSSPSNLNIDTVNNVWVVDRGGPKSVFKIAASASGSTFNGGGATGSTPAVGYTVLGTSPIPVSLAVDGNNTPWFIVNNTTTGANAACSQSVTVQGTVLETVQSGAVVTAGPGGASGQLVIDAGNPSCSPSTSVLCNATVYDTTTSGTISGSPFVWVAFNTGQGTTITTNSNSAGTLGNFYTGKAGFTVNGCGTPLNALGSPNVTASADAPATGIPAINPSGSDQIDYLVKPRGLAIGQNGAIWNTNNAAADALKTSTYSLTKFTPTYGSAFTPASLISSSAAFTNYTGGGLSATSFTPQFMMIDGSGGPWIAGVSTVAGVAGVVQFDVNGNAISPSNGYIGTTFTSGSTVYSRLVGLGGYGIAIDGSGNVWVPDSDTGSASPSVLSNTVNVIVGSATPVVTPLALGIKNGTLGMMP